MSNKEKGAEQKQQSIMCSNERKMKNAMRGGMPHTCQHTDLHGSRLLSYFMWNIFVILSKIMKKDPAASNILEVLVFLQFSEKQMKPTFLETKVLKQDYLQIIGFIADLCSTAKVKDQLKHRYDLKG